MSKTFPNWKNHLFLKQALNAPTSIKPAIQLGSYFHPFFMEQITFSTQDIFVKVICLYCIKGPVFVCSQVWVRAGCIEGGNVRRHPWWWNDGNPGPRRPAPLPLHRCTGALHIIRGYQQMQKSALASAQVHTCQPAEVTVRDAQEQGDPRWAFNSHGAHRFDCHILLPLGPWNIDKMPRTTPILEFTFKVIRS